ncbi:DUF6408 family protein [Streptomyces sp. BI20]
MDADEYKPARRERIREILIDIVIGTVSNLVVTGLTAMVSLFF